MAILQIRGGCHVVDKNSIAVRNGVMLGHAQQLVAGDVVISRVPEQWHMGDYDIPISQERYTIGRFPEAYYAGMVSTVCPAEVREKLMGLGMGDRDIDRFMNVEEEEVVLLTPPPEVVTVVVSPEEDGSYW